MQLTLYQAIIEHHLPPGTKLPEDTLADAFGVSRTRIRTVLQLLSHDGIVELHKFKGAFVAQPSPKEAREVFQARRILERGIISAIIHRTTSSDIKKLRKMVKMESAAILQDDRRSAIKLSGAFHVELSKILENATVTGQLRDLVSRTSLIIAVYSSAAGPICNSTHHERLVDAIEASDEEKAIATLLDDLEKAERVLALETQTGSSIDLRRVVTSLSQRVSGD
jgi:DNA-binding GntR family transcriptional regulator